jgi:hypothetical protein
LGLPVEIRRSDFFMADLSGATFIYAYLLPRTVKKLTPKFSAELKPGTKILLPSFPIDTEINPEFKLLKTQKFGRIIAYLYEKI